LLLLPHSGKCVTGNVNSTMEVGNILILNCLKIESVLNRIIEKIYGSVT